MSLAHRVGMVITIALAIKGGRVPTARAMTLPDLYPRQETSVAAVAIAGSSAPGPADTPILSSSIAISTSISASAAPTVASAATSGAATASIISATLAPTTPTLSASIASVSAAVSTISVSASMSNTLNSTTTSLPKTANSTLAEELGSPLPKPNYAPGGMAFILPAFVIVGLIFIIWLMHKTKEYIWKLREAEAAADTQSPNPGAGPKGPKGAAKGGEREKPAGGLGGKWKKKGWKELESDSEDDDQYGPRGGRGEDRYSRVGEWQGSRKYRSRDGGAEGRYPRDRDDGHRDGGERGKYGRLDGHDDDRHYRRDPVPVPDRRPSRRDDRRRDSDHQHPRDRPRSRNESGRPHSPAPSHVSRALSKKEKKERAAEWINDGRHHVSERRDSGRRDDGGGKGKERERRPDTYEDYERGYSTGQHFSLMPPADDQRPRPGGAQLEVQIGAAAIRANQQLSSTVHQPVLEAPAPAKPLQRTKTSREAAPPTAGSIQQSSVPTASGPSHEDVPAYMRARAASPPPILSPPLNPNLFFHNGPSTASLVPLHTYDSGTDLESMISAQPSPLPGNDDHGRMPDVPSTAEKLERSATTGPGRTVRKPQTPTSSRLVARTPTRTKSHDPSSVPPGTPSAAGGKAEVLRTPTRRGTDGVKTAGRATPTIRLIDSRGGSIRQTPDLSKVSGLTPKKYSKRIAPIAAPSATPETIRRVRAQKKELKARGKVDAILRDSWSERAVVSPVDKEAGEEEEEDEEEVEVDVDEEQAIRSAGKVPRDEVEMAHSRAGASSPTPSPTPAAVSLTPRTKSQQGDRPTSPLKIRPTSPSTIPGVDSADIRSLQGIDQRMALMKQLEERVKR